MIGISHPCPEASVESHPRALTLKRWTVLSRRWFVLPKRLGGGKVTVTEAVSGGSGDRG